MDLENIRRLTIEQGIEQDERSNGYDARWNQAAYREDASDEWKAGWREADYELSGNEDAEF
jgi:hypothetical protein